MTKGMTPEKFVSEKKTLMKIQTRAHDSVRKKLAITVVKDYGKL
jgi:hypothetical protein